MTVHIEYQTLVSDFTIHQLRQLTEAASLTVRNGELDFAQKNLANLMERLTAIQDNRPPQCRNECVYGRTSVLDITLL